MTEIADSKEEYPEIEPRGEAIKRGRKLIGIFAFLLVFLGVIYVYIHYVHPGGLLSPKIALPMVQEANEVLGAPDDPEDDLSPKNINDLTRLSERLRVLEPQLGANANYKTTLSKIADELGKDKASRSVLRDLFELLKSIIEVGSGSYFWTGSVDRWIELGLWAFFGNLVFLLNEIKNEMETYFPQITKKNGVDGFIKPTPWYVVYFFRGPFIAMVILVALSSISLEVVGVSLDLITAPIEVSIVLAAILGFYSRVAAAQLEIITKNLLGRAWEKVYPKDKEIEENKKDGEESQNNKPVSEIGGNIEP